MGYAEVIPLCGGSIRGGVNHQCCGSCCHVVACGTTSDSRGGGVTRRYHTVWRVGHGRAEGQRNSGVRGGRGGE